MGVECWVLDETHFISSITKTIACKEIHRIATKYYLCSLFSLSLN